MTRVLIMVSNPRVHDTNIRRRHLQFLHVILQTCSQAFDGLRQRVPKLTCILFVWWGIRELKPWTWSGRRLSFDFDYVGLKVLLDGVDFVCDRVRDVSLLTMWDIVAARGAHYGAVGHRGTRVGIFICQRLLLQNMSANFGLAVSANGNEPTCFLSSLGSKLACLFITVTFSPKKLKGFPFCPWGTLDMDALAMLSGKAVTILVE